MEKKVPPTFISPRNPGWVGLGWQKDLVSMAKPANLDGRLNTSESFCNVIEHCSIVNLPFHLVRTKERAKCLCKVKDSII